MGNSSGSMFYAFGAILNHLSRRSQYLSIGLVDKEMA